jgi:hypothetical protein
MHSANTHPAVAWVITVLGLLWAGLMLAVIIDKIHVYGIADQVQFFTNWAWFILAVFLFATAGSLLIVTYRIRGPLRTWTCAIYAIFLIPCWLIAIVVLTVVLLMILTGATFLTDILRTTALSNLIVGNELMHFDPVFIYVVILLVNARLIYFSINELLAGLNHNKLLFWSIVFTEVYIMPNIPLVFYRAFFDPAVVYGTNLNQIIGVAFIIGVETVFGGLPVFVAIVMFGLGEKHIREEFIDGDAFISEAMIISSNAQSKFVEPGRYTYR